MAPGQRLAKLGSHVIVVSPRPRASPSLVTHTTSTSQTSRVVPHVDVPHFVVGAPEATSYLAEHGYVVFADVLTPQECEAGVSGVWDWLEALGKSAHRVFGSKTPNGPSVWSALTAIQTGYRAIQLTLHVAVSSTTPRHRHSARRPSQLDKRSLATSTRGGGSKRSD